MTAWRTILRMCWVTLVVACLAGCRTSYSNPEFKVASKVVSGRLDRVALAITNSFSNGAYHGCRFFYSPCDFVQTNGQEVSLPTTNTWVLAAERMPLTLIRRGKTMVGYQEDFDIKAEPVDAARTKVSVTPAASGTMERTYELSMHLNRISGGRYIPPLASETTNVFLRIEQALAAIEDGHTEALAPTTDTQPSFYRTFWTELTVEEKHDRRNWDDMIRAWNELQEGHNKHLPTAPR